jgi:hypothetical protein
LCDACRVTQTGDDTRGYLRVMQTAPSGVKGSSCRVVLCRCCLRLDAGAAATEKEEEEQGDGKHPALKRGRTGEAE